MFDRIHKLSLLGAETITITESFVNWNQGDGPVTVQIRHSVQHTCGKGKFEQRGRVWQFASHQFQKHLAGEELLQRALKYTEGDEVDLFAELANGYGGYFKDTRKSVTWPIFPESCHCEGDKPKDCGCRLGRCEKGLIF